MTQSAFDPVSKPQHYQSGSGFELIQLTRYLDFNLGNAVKYVYRAGKKGGPEKELEDLKKAMVYVDFFTCMIDEKTWLPGAKAREYALEAVEEFLVAMSTDRRLEYSDAMPSMRILIITGLVKMFTDPYETRNVTTILLDDEIKELERKTNA